MERSSKLFTSFAEQEVYYLGKMRNTSVKDRIVQFYATQQPTQAFDTVIDKTRNPLLKIELYKA